MEDTCTACHGSRVAAEYFGQNPGMEPDVHLLKGMVCTDCHGKNEMHGDGKGADHRYAAAGSPRCVNCHKEIYSKSPAAKTHLAHRGKASCHVCHSQEYKNCFSCHVSMKDGKPHAETSPSRMDFRIGLNPLKNDRHPERYVVLRHAPAVPTAFDSIKEGALKKFDSMPTWRTATPHNIRRITPRNSSCDSCHGNPKPFLRGNDVDPPLRRANRPVIVPESGIPSARK